MPGYSPHSLCRVFFMANIRWTNELKRNIMELVVKGYHMPQIARKLKVDEGRLKRMMIRWKDNEGARTMPEFVHILHLNGYFNEKDN